MRRDAQGMTYQSSPWHTQAVGQPARSGMEYFGLYSTSMPCLRWRRGTSTWSQRRMLFARKHDLGDLGVFSRKCR